MTYTVAALYQFVSLPDGRELRAPLLALCLRLGLKGTLLLADEGINGTIAGRPDAIRAAIDDLCNGPLFGGRLSDLNLRFATADEMPFGRMKVRLKREIVTLGDPSGDSWGDSWGDPRRRVGAYVDPLDWNDLLARPDVVVIDTRNRFEVAMGSFAGAIDPGLGRFSDFRRFAREQLDPGRDTAVAMFCTGGIRCEKASAYLLAQGFGAVHHLKGGILHYLETVPEASSRWSGSCFVFDERIAVGHDLRPIAPQRTPGD